MAGNLVDTHFVLRGPNPERRFVIEVDLSVDVEDLKPGIIRAIGDVMGVALNPKEYKISLAGVLGRSEVIVERKWL